MTTCQDCAHRHDGECVQCEDAAQVGCLAPCATICTHEPNARGTACQHCGISAEMVTPDELADAMMAALDAARIAASGQTSWLDAPAPVDRCWSYRHGTTNSINDLPRCTRTDWHDGPHEWPVR